MMNLELYKIFYEVAKNGSISAASRALFISQPAVSQAIHKLEQSLDTRLFVRGPRGVVPTAEGAMLLTFVERGLNAIQSGERQLGAIGMLQAGELRIGSGDSITRHFLLPHLGRFHQLYPSVSIEVYNRTSLEIIQRLKQGAIDLAVVNLPIHDDALHILPCGQVHDIFVATQTFADLLNRPVSMQELVAAPLIMLEDRSNSRRYVDSCFAAAGVDLAPEIELGAYELLLDFALIDLGVACVIEEYASHALATQQIKKIDLQPPLPPRNIGLCHLRDQPLSPAAQQFMQIVEAKI